jgi:hypothetical protein
MTDPAPEPLAGLFGDAALRSVETFSHSTHRLCLPTAARAKLSTIALAVVQASEAGRSEERGDGTARSR